MIRNYSNIGYPLQVTQIFSKKVIARTSGMFPNPSDHQRDGAAHIECFLKSSGVSSGNFVWNPAALVFRGIRVGISLDGDRAANDRHRRYADGCSSYDKVIAAIGLLRSRFLDLYGGLLCTIDVANDPVAVYESLMELGPPQIDFLLPHATWDDPPARAQAAGTEYGDWLIAIFDRWRFSPWRWRARCPAHRCPGPPAPSPRRPASWASWRPRAAARSVRSRNRSPGPGGRCTN